MEAVSKQHLQQAIRYLTQELLDESHYRKLYLFLPVQWEGLHSFSAAVKLMEEYGVTMSKNETEMLSSMNEMQQINQLVTKMPSQDADRFQEFFRQLQLIVSTATRVRQALGEGRSDLVENALEDAEGFGISQYILKLAMVQAGTEVTVLRQAFETAVKEWERTMGKLLREQEDVVQAQRRLLAAQEQLVATKAGQNERTKKVLLSMTTNTAVILSNAFTSWLKQARREREERLIWAEYEQRVEVAKDRLMQCRTEGLKVTRDAFTRQAEDAEGTLLVEIFATWKEHFQEAKRELEVALQVAELEEKLKALMDNQSNAAFNVMMRMQAGEDEECLRVALQAWTTHMGLVRQENNLHRAVDDVNGKLAAFIQEKSDRAKSILGNMTSSTVTGLLSQVLKSWGQYLAEKKQEQEYSTRWQRALDKIEAMSVSCKRSSHRALGSLASMEDSLHLVRLLHEWRRVLKVDRMQQGCMNKYEGKRQQLTSVQKMFRDFAVKMESQKFNDADPGRNHEDFTRKRESVSRSQFATADGAFSLPDIHKLGSQSGGKASSLTSYATSGGQSRQEPPRRPTSAAARSHSHSAQAQPAFLASSDDVSEAYYAPRSAWS